MSSRPSQTSPHTTGRRSVAAPTAEAADPTPVPVTAATPTAAQVAVPVSAAPAPADALEAPTFQLSVKQLLAGAAAAITAAVLGSRLGVAGTLIGAGLASSVSMIAAAVYSHSLATAAYKVKLARTHADAVAATPTEPIAVAHQAWGELPTVVMTPVARPAAPPSPRGWRSRWVAAGVGVVAACAIALLAVTGIEAVRGTPLSGGSAGGLSVLGGASVGTADTPATTGRTAVVTTDPETVPVSPTAADPTSADSPAPATSTTVTSTVTVTPVVPSTPAEPSTEPPTSSPSTAATIPSTTPSTTADPTTTATPTATVPPANERATATP